MPTRDGAPVPAQEMRLVYFQRSARLISAVSGSLSNGRRAIGSRLLELALVSKHEKPVERGQGQEQRGRDQNQSDNYEGAATKMLGNARSKDFTLGESVHERQIIAVRSNRRSTLWAKPPIVFLGSQAMVTNQNCFALIYCIVNLLSPRVRGTGGRHEPEHKPVNDEGANAKDYKRHNFCVIARTHTRNTPPQTGDCKVDL